MERKLVITAEDQLIECPLWRPSQKEIDHKIQELG